MPRLKNPFSRKSKKSEDDVDARTNILGAINESSSYEDTSRYEHVDNTRHYDDVFQRHGLGRRSKSETELNKIKRENKRQDEDLQAGYTEEQHTTRLGSHSSLLFGPLGGEHRTISYLNVSESKAGGGVLDNTLLNYIIEENERLKSEIESLKKRPGPSDYATYIQDHIVKPEDIDYLKRFINDRFKRFEDLLKKTSETIRGDIFSGLAALKRTHSFSESGTRTGKKPSIPREVQSLCNSLCYLVGGKWLEFGMALKIPPDILGTIQPYGSRVELKGAFVDIIMKWNEYVGASVEGLISACEEIGVSPLTDKPMSPTHREVIQNKSSYLRKNVKLEVLCSYLGDNQIISVEETQYIRSTKVRNDQFDRLLDVLPLAGENVYLAFIDALRNTHHEFVANEFTKEESRLLNCKRQDYVEQFKRERTETRPSVTDRSFTEMESKSTGQVRPSTRALQESNV